MVPINLKRWNGFSASVFVLPRMELDKGVDRLVVSYLGTATRNCFTAFDGNGHAAALVNAADGTCAFGKSA